VQVMIAKRMSGDVPSVRRARASVPVALDEVLTRTLAPIPSNRLASAAAVAAALAVVSRDTAAVFTPTSSSQKRSRLRQIIIVALLVVAVVALVIGSRWTRERTRPSTPITSRPLTFAGSAEQPAYSPNGRQMAYVQTECKTGQKPECLVTLRVQDIGSEQSVVLATATWVVWPQWSPDGAWILVRLMEHEHLATYLVPRFGGAPREIGPFGFTSFTPNGDTILLVEHALRDGNAVLRHVRPFTGEMLDSARIRLPLTTLTNFTASPDGRWLAFAGQGRRGAEVLLARADGRIVDSISVSPLETMRWSQSGDALYTFSGGAGLNNWLLRIRVEQRRGRFAEKVDTLLSMPTLGAGEFDLAPDGRSLVYAGGPVTTTIWAFDLAEKPGLPRRLIASTSRIRQPSLSSDGQLIAYSATDQVGDNVYVIPFEGGNAQRVTYDASGYGGTQWFPNRHRLMYQRWAPKLEAFVQELPQGARHLAAQVEDGQGILPLPDGGMVVQVAVFHLVFLDPNGTRISEIVLPDSLGDDVSLFSADADGRSIYVRAIPLAPYRPHLFRVDRTSGALALMDELPIAKAPQPLGARHNVQYATWEPGSVHHPTIWRLPPGGPATKVRELPFECDPSTLSMSLDERRFVCSASVSTMDIFLVEHLDTFRR
jgi:Tol biopolymer transport system component